MSNEFGTKANENVLRFEAKKNYVIFIPYCKHFKQCNSNSIYFFTFWSFRKEHRYARFSMHTSCILWNACNAWRAYIIKYVINVYYILHRTHTSSSFSVVWIWFMTKYWESGREKVRERDEEGGRQRECRVCECMCGAF